MKRPTPQQVKDTPILTTPVHTPVHPNMVEPGLRIQVHPATDLWMRGDRYGIVIRQVAMQDGNDPVAYIVHMDVSGLDRTIDINDIYEVFK